MAEERLSLKIIVASTRPGRVGPSVGKWISDYAENHGAFNVELLDLADFDLPLLDEPHHPLQRRYERDHTIKWSQAIDGGDAYIFVTPEYDYFAPASLVNAIQYLAHEWHYKPVGLVGYGGISGGLRSVQAIKPLLTSVKLVPLPESVSVQYVTKQIDDGGVFTPEETQEQAANLMLDELHKWAAPLKSLHS